MRGSLYTLWKDRKVLMEYVRNNMQKMGGECEACNVSIYDMGRVNR